MGCTGLGRRRASCRDCLTDAANYAISWKSLERVFLVAGFEFKRQEGSHRSYVRKGVLRPIVIPTYDEVPVSIIRNNLRTEGLSREEYFKLLSEA